jgi:hypothetical protein
LTKFSFVKSKDSDLKGLGTSKKNKFLEIVEMSKGVLFEMKEFDEKKRKEANKLRELEI